MSATTTNFELVKPESTDGVDISVINGNMDTIDTEMARPPLTVNGTSPDANREITINTVPFAENLTSDESQSITGAFVIRASGGNASIANGTASVANIKGNAVKSGYVEEFINLTAYPVDPSDEDAISVTYDRATLVAYMASSGTVTFNYTSSWSPNPTTYGITVSGTPASGDQIVLVYVKGNRGTIAIPSPVKLISTGWNLYNHAAGYARVVKYSADYGFIISGSYSALQFATTQGGSRTTITPSGGYFTIPNDGYLFVTDGNATDTAVYMTWSDWTSGTPRDFEAYTQSEIDLSGVMVNFPNGLMRVGSVADEISISTQTAIKRIERMEYTDENVATIETSGLAYDTDTNWIYYVRSEPVSYDISLEGDYTVSDHGTEMFSGVTTPVYSTNLYGWDLSGKLRRDVLTISAQELSDNEKAQVRENIGAANVSLESLLNRAFLIRNYTASITVNANSYKSASASAMGVVAIDGYTPVAIIGATTGSSNLVIYRVFATTDGNVISVKNVSSGALTKNVNVRILWVKNGLIGG